jgi:hypothetical protein
MNDTLDHFALAAAPAEAIANAAHEPTRGGKR